MISEILNTTALAPWLYGYVVLIYSYILCQVVKTNHWTTGKKIVCGMVFAFIWYQIVAIYIITTTPMAPTLLQQLFLHGPVIAVGTYAAGKMLCRSLNY